MVTRQQGLLRWQQSGHAALAAVFALLCIAQLPQPAQGIPPGLVDNYGSDAGRPSAGATCKGGDEPYERFIDYCGAPFRAEHCYCSGGTWACLEAVPLPCDAGEQDTAGVQTTSASATTPISGIGDGGDATVGRGTQQPDTREEPEPGVRCHLAGDVDYSRWVDNCGKQFRAVYCFCDATAMITSGKGHGKTPKAHQGAWRCMAAVPLPCEVLATTAVPPPPLATTTDAPAPPLSPPATTHSEAPPPPTTPPPTAGTTVAESTPRPATQTVAATTTTVRQEQQGCVLHASKFIAGLANGPAASGPSGGWPLSRCIAACRSAPAGKCKFAVHSPTATNLTPAGYCELWTAVHTSVGLQPYQGFNTYECAELPQTTAPPPTTTTAPPPTTTPTGVAPSSRCSRLSAKGTYRGDIISVTRAPRAMTLRDKWDWCARNCALAEACAYWYFAWGNCRLQSSQTKFQTKNIQTQSHGLRDNSASCIGDGAGLNAKETAAVDNNLCKPLPEVGYYKAKLIRTIKLPNDVKPRDWRWCASECAKEEACKYWIMYYSKCLLKGKRGKFVPRKAQMIDGDTDANCLIE